MKKTILLGLTATLLSIGFTLLLIEIVLRFLPVSTGLTSLPVTRESPVARFRPDSDFVWSKGWTLALARRGHINNDGFVNDQDYDAAAPGPLMAVIGDSYVEAVMVPYPETIQGRLAQDAAPDARVYSFAASGAPLSQYLVWADYARKTYKPSAMTFVIVGNDFDESLPRYVLHQTFHQFAPGEDGALQPALLREFRPSWRRAVVKSSALARYVFFNLDAWLAWSRIKQAWMRRGMEEAEPAYVANTSVSTDEQRMDDSRRAVDAFFALLPDRTGLAARDIAFVVDANRQAVYQSTPDAQRTSYFDAMRRYFIGQARRKGYTVIDMDGPFSSHYAQHRRHFEYPEDWHWNELGHQLAAEALEETDFYARFLRAGP